MYYFVGYISMSLYPKADTITVVNNSNIVFWTHISCVARVWYNVICPMLNVAAKARVRCVLDTRRWLLVAVDRHFIALRLVRSNKRQGLCRNGWKAVNIIRLSKHFTSIVINKPARLTVGRIIRKSCGVSQKTQGQQYDVTLSYEKVNLNLPVVKRSTRSTE